MEKQVLRQQILERLKQIPAAQHQELSARIIQRVLSHASYQRAATIAAYDSAGTEVNMLPLLEEILRSDKTLCLPRTESKSRQMTMHAVKDLAKDLEVSRFGFREPRAELAAVAPEKLHLIIVPGVAFDIHCNRLGRGAGYYDRYLSRLAPGATACALAFECQIAEAIPVMEHDRGVSLIFTEQRIIEARV